MKPQASPTWRGRADRRKAARTYKTSSQTGLRTAQLAAPDSDVEGHQDLLLVGGLLGPIPTCVICGWPLWVPSPLVLVVGGLFGSCPTGADCGRPLRVLSPLASGPTWVQSCPKTCQSRGRSHTQNRTSRRHQPVHTPQSGRLQAPISKSSFSGSAPKYPQIELI